MDYRRRVVDDELDVLLGGGVRALAVEGAKGVGKTWTARRRAGTVHALDEPAQRQLAEADPQRLAEGEPPILIDEWQRVPASWDVVRRAVDASDTSGRFLLTGSASPAQPPTHSGAGRIVTVRMRPFTLAERDVATPTVSLEALFDGSAEIGGETDVGLEVYAREIVRSGFPALRASSDERVLRAELDGYITRIVERDFVESGHPVRRPQVLRRWLHAYAAATATTASYEKIREAASSGQNLPAVTTVIPYRDTLQSLWVIDEVPGWRPSGTPLRRLVERPKHHLVDPALAARLLNVGTQGLLQGRTTEAPAPRDGLLLGMLFESLVTQSVRVYAQHCEAQLHHLRLKGGDREIDLIVERHDGRLLALEVKLGTTVGDDDVRHLRWLREQLGADLADVAVITAGSYAFRRRDGVAVIPAALLGP